MPNLTDMFDPHKYHSESHVVRHYKTNSGLNTPANEVPSYEKVISEKEKGHAVQNRKKKHKIQREEIYITSECFRTFNERV
jgi:hypothetical protein